MLELPVGGTLRGAGEEKVCNCFEGVFIEGLGVAILANRYAECAGIPGGGIGGNVVAVGRSGVITYCGEWRNLHSLETIWSLCKVLAFQERAIYCSRLQG